MTLPHFTFKIGGFAGQGIKSTGLLFSKLAARSGYHIYDHTEYPSVIRGGHNVMQVTLSPEKISFTTRHTNFLVALNQETINLHRPELLPNSGLLFDSDSQLDTSGVGSDIRLFPIPLTKIAHDSGGVELISNTVALGASIALLGGDFTRFKNLIEDEFTGQDQAKDTNLAVALAGFNYAIEHFPDRKQEILKPLDTAAPQIVVNANDAVTLGAIAAGLQFAAIYPMTPTSNILHNLAPLTDKYGFIYQQPEDEIAAICMAIGASFAGARSLVATSGGGFCLMAEAYGLAGMTETPLVIIEGMRGGPSTGLPTWNEQGDLWLALHAHQGNIPNIVLAAGDPEEAFHLTTQAFNLADKYQTPVLILLDKSICEDDQSCPPFDTTGYQIDKGKLATQTADNYQRYLPTDDGISPRAFPGSGNFFIANSDEHDPTGYSDESAQNRRQQMAKRMRKLETCAQNDMPPPKIFGPENADITIVSWGSNKGSILEALKSLPNVNFLYLNWLNPFPAKDVHDRLSKAKYILNIECNYTAQMAGLIRQKTGIAVSDNLLKFDGRPIYPEEIIDKINSINPKQ